MATPSSPPARYWLQASNISRRPPRGLYRHEVSVDQLFRRSNRWLKNRDKETDQESDCDSDTESDFDATNNEDFKTCRELTLTLRERKRQSKETEEKEAKRNEDAAKVPPPRLSVGTVDALTKTFGNL